MSNGKFFRRQTAYNRNGVSQMSEEQAKDRKLFTIDQANAMLPLVRAIVEDLSNAQAINGVCGRMTPTGSQTQRL